MTKQRFEYLSAQFDPNSIRRIAAEIERQKKSKRDYVLPMTDLAFSDDGSLTIQKPTAAVGDRVFVDFADAEAELDRARQAVLDDERLSPAEVAEQVDQLKIVAADAGAAIRLSTTARQQLFHQIDVPKRFADKLAGREWTDGDDKRFCGDILGTMMTDLLAREPKRVMLRCLDGKVRAIVSENYRALDNCDLFYKAAGQFKTAGATLWKARLSDDSFELFGVADHIAGEVRLDRPFDPGDGWMSRWAGGDGDVQNAAVRITNSETGRGGLNVNMSIVTKICANFCVWGQGVMTIHRGKKAEVDDSGLVIASDKTRRLESEAVWSRIEDAIATAFDATAFQKLIDKMNNATQVEIPSDRIEAAVDNVIAEYQIDEEAKAGILDEILATGDRSQYGLTQAITNGAHAADRREQPEKATTFESVGAAVLDKTPQQFEKLLVVAAD